MTARAQSRERLTTLTICAVRHGDDLAVGRAHPGDAQGDVLDGAGGRLAGADDADRDDVAEAVLPLGDDEEPGEHVADDPLGAEAEPDAEHRRRGDQSGHRHAEPVEHEEHGDRVDETIATQVSTWVSEWRCLAASERTSASPPVDGVDPVGDPAARPSPEPGEQHRADDDQHDLEAAAGEPVAQLGQGHPCRSPSVGSSSRPPPAARPGCQTGQRGSTNSACEDRPIAPVSSKRTA